MKDMTTNDFNSKLVFERYYKMYFLKIAAIINRLDQHYLKMLIKLFLTSWLALSIGLLTNPKLNILWIFAWPTLMLLLFILSLFILCILGMISITIRYGILCVAKRKK